jgi:hypothetical protein
VEARTLHASGGSVIAVADLLQHARELLDIIDDEVSVNGLALPDDVRNGLLQMRGNLASLEQILAVRH